MLTFKRKSGIFIPKEYENSAFYIGVKNKLTRYIKDYNTSVRHTLYFYEENENGMKIPRFFPIQQYVNCKIEDCIDKGKKIKIKTNIVPKNNIQEKSMQYLINNNAVLQLKPGMGKTVISIYVLAQLKLKTIILVHRQSLVDQWFERILQFTDLDSSNIGILSSFNYQDVLISKDIIISTVQSFMAAERKNKIDFEKYLEDAQIGLFIADEVHTSVGAPTFSKCSLNIPAGTRVIGLSATPYRWDGNGDIIDFHLGNVFSIDSCEGIMGSKVVTILFHSGLLASRKRYLYWGGKFQRSRYLTILRKSNILMAIIKKLINQIENDREVIFVAERIKFLDECMKICKNENKINFISGVALEDVLSKQIIFTTPGKMRDGVDISHKDCLVMTSPISNIEQMVGRIVREHENKQTPIIFDLVDLDIKDISRTFYKRCTYYESNKWPIKFIYANKGKFDVIAKNEAMMLIQKGG